MSAVRDRPGARRPAPGRVLGAPRERAGRRWLLALGALLLGALILRLWGVGHGLPFVYNADENAHFVPRAIGMFGHSLNPGYFINPPAFTYVLHAAFAVAYGSREAVGDALARDPTGPFTLARVLSGLLGTLAVGALAWAGARAFGRRVALLAGLVLAVAFLPVHYSHLALNDVPTLAPLCLGLVGVAGVHRRGRLSDYVLAGAGLGVACATKYTAGVLLLALVAVARRPAGLGVAGAAALAGFLVANPYALLDFETFWDGLSEQTSTANDGGGKLGLTQESGILYYLGTLTWGLGWVPALAALGGAALLARRDPRLAAALVLPPLALVLVLGVQDRFFARWLLPAYPFLCLLAAYLVVALAGRRRLLLAGAAAFLAAQGVVFSVHNDLVLAREDTRNLAREWLVANVPAGTKMVVEPVFPDQWATDPGNPSRVTGNGARWRKWPTSRSEVRNDGRIVRGEGRVVKLEDYERTTRPALLDAYVAGGYCWVVAGSTQYGRAFAEPREVPQAIRYYAELRRRGEVVHRVAPAAGPRPFSFDFSFNAYPLSVRRPGPEIVVYRLRGGRCGS